MKYNKNKAFVHMAETVNLSISAKGMLRYLSVATLRSHRPMIFVLQALFYVQTSITPERKWLE